MNCQWPKLTLEYFIHLEYYYSSFPLDKSKLSPEITIPAQQSLTKSHMNRQRTSEAVLCQMRMKKLTSRQMQHSSCPESGLHLCFPWRRLSRHTLQTSQWNDLSRWILQWGRIKLVSCGILESTRIFLPSKSNHDIQIGLFVVFYDHNYPQIEVSESFK